jgi:hypothetical protein
MSQPAADGVEAVAEECAAEVAVVVECAAEVACRAVE